MLMAGVAVWLVGDLLTVPMEQLGVGYILIARIVMGMGEVCGLAFESSCRHPSLPDRASTFQPYTIWLRVGSRGTNAAVSWLY